MFWLVVAALVALGHRFVPESTWLMIHLVLLGALTHAILVWSRYFADTLVRLPATPRREQSQRLALFNLGVVVVAVGLHFVPFAWAFRAPIFGWIGWSLTGIGVAGLVGGLVAGAEPVRAAAVLTGLVMLAFMALHTRSGSPTAVGATGPALEHATAAKRSS